jgi:hypothetical protein
MVSIPQTMIRARDGDRCARCGGGNTLHVHHRWLRSQGGTDTFGNQVTLCAACHHWVHHHVADALADGWLVASASDPLTVPVRHHLWPAGPVLLCDDGGIDIRLWS